MKLNYYRISNCTKQVLFKHKFFDITVCIAKKLYEDKSVNADFKLSYNIFSITSCL